MADLRGHVGISYDQAAWLDSAYNASLMFIGPFSVYVGGLLGPRRVLLFAAGVFTVTCAFLPLIHNYSLLVTALIVAGLTSGTFYPLTLTFALRISPLRYLPFTMAFYATFIDGAVNVAPSLYGWYRDHLSWHWMFWNSAVIAPVMIILIYFGIPAAPPRKKGEPVPSFAGFLYLSAGLALMFAAIQQGERLDWWRSGVFNALFWSGAFFTLCALIRRLRGPNPLVALPYLWQRNTILLGALLFWFRFTLTGTIILIPQSLAIHGFEADQIGPAVIWSAVPLLLITFIAGLLLIRNLDPRLLLAAGLTCTAFAVCLNADLHCGLVGGELLSHGVAHGRRTVGCSHRTGGMHHPAGSLLWGLDETSVDPDIFCVLSYHSLVWWHHGCRVHGPLSCGPREAALEPSRLARAIRKLDHRRQHPGARRRECTRNLRGWLRPRAVRWES